MPAITRRRAAPTRSVRPAVPSAVLGTVGVLAFLVLSGPGALGSDDTSSGLGADEATHFLPAPSGGCVLDARYLPRTPDAVEGWYRGCRLHMSRESGCSFDPKQLPRTPDAVEGWYRSCLSRP